MKKYKKITYTYKGYSFDYIIGNSARNNWEIIFDQVEDLDDIEERQEWIWFHLDGLPSAHVILCLTDEDTKITGDGKKMSKDKTLKHFIKYGGILCKKYSKKENEKLKIIWTQVENLSKGKYPGEVLVKKSNIFTI